jgi:ankyrin repeat protein
MTQTAQKQASLNLTLAVYQNDIIAVEAFLKQSVGFDKMNSTHRAAFADAVINGYTGIVSLMLDAGADVEEKEFPLMSPLMSAACRNHVETVRLLLDRGASIDLVSRSNRMTALMFAALKGRVETGRLLIARGADINIATRDGKTAMTFAKEWQHTEFVQILKEVEAHASVVKKQAQLRVQAPRIRLKTGPRP